MQFYQISAKADKYWPLSNEMSFKWKGKIGYADSYGDKKFPFFKNFFPGVGGDYHYFGTIEIGKKGILSVDEKCRLKNNNEIYVIDGCVFNFKKNMYPLGLVMANAKRVAKILN